jgi:putative transposase
MSYQLYPSDLTDREWEYIKRLIPAAKSGGRKRQTDMRLTINAIFDHLRNLAREREGRERQPTAAILDSQSVRTTDRGGPERGFDAGKLIYGRKRHILVDTLGLLLLVVVHSASAQDRDGARTVLAPLANRFSKLRKIWVDSIYNDGIAQWVRNLRQRNRIELEIVKRPEGVKGFLVLARRWVVERTFAWLSFHRRLSKDYEYLPETSEAFIRIAMIRLMLARLT